MIRTFGVSLLAVTTALVVTLPAAAQAPAAPAPEPEVLIADFRRPQPAVELTEDEIVVACLRLPRLADLSRERWNEVHRRYDSGRGRREKLRT